MLEEAYICSVRGGGHCDGKIIHIGDDEASGNTLVKGRDVCDKQERRNGRTLGDAH